MVIVSHSQDFLNGVCTNIIHMQEKTLKYYGVRLVYLYRKMFGSEIVHTEVKLFITLMKGSAQNVSIVFSRETLTAS